MIWNAVICAAIGATMATAGINPGNWQLWAVLFLAGANNFAGYMKGKK